MGDALALDRHVRRIGLNRVDAEQETAPHIPIGRRLAARHGQQPRPLARDYGEP
jgi:hypothetical protein